MITNSQLKILEQFRNNPLNSWTFNELKNVLRESSNSKLQNAIKNFEEESLILVKRNKGFNLISLNPKSERVFLYFSLIDLEKISKKLIPLFEELREIILEKTSFFSLVLFGSYSKGNYSKNSDVDIAIIFEDKKMKELVDPEINSLKRKSLFDLDIQYFLKNEFLEMLKSKKVNLGKEIAKNFRVFYGGENFYNLILKKWRA